MQIFIDNDRLLIAYRAGTSERAIISFSGIGAFRDGGGLPREEFVQTLSGDDDHQYFVIDKIRSWYNSTSEEIVDVLGRELLNHSSCITLGNSMGGFGAVYFASQLPGCKAALAFGPQFSVNPDIAPRERRWLDWRAAIDQWKVPHAFTAANTGMRFYLFFGDASDRYQAKLYRSNPMPKMAMIVVAGQKHNTASYLRDQAMLVPVIHAVWHGMDVEPLRMLLHKAGIETLDSNSQG